MTCFYLDIWIKAVLVETPPVLPCVKVQLVHTRSKQFPGNETWAPSVSISSPVEKYTIQFVTVTDKFSYSMRR